MIVNFVCVDLAGLKDAQIVVKTLILHAIHAKKNVPLSYIIYKDKLRMD